MDIQVYFVFLSCCNNGFGLVFLAKNPISILPFHLLRRLVAVLFWSTFLKSAWNILAFLIVLSIACFFSLLLITFDFTFFDFSISSDALSPNRYSVTLTFISQLLMREGLYNHLLNHPEEILVSSSLNHN